MEQVLTYSLWRGPCQVGGYTLKETWPMKSPSCFILRTVVEITHTGAGEKCEEEGAAERDSYRLTASPISHPNPELLGGNGVEEAEELRKKE